MNVYRVCVMNEENQFFPTSGVSELFGLFTNIYFWKFPGLFGPQPKGKLACKVLRLNN